MNKECRNIISIVLLLIILNVVFMPVKVYGEKTNFIDVPKGHWAEEHIYKLKEIGIIQGELKDEKELVFGIDNYVTREEFLSMIMKLTSNMSSIEKETEVIFNNANSGSNFSNENITKLEAVKVIIGALGYDYLAKGMNSRYIESDNPYEDVGYIEIAIDLGIINKNEKENILSEELLITRAEAATMISKTYSILNNKLETLHGFYAISSYSQIDKISNFDSIGFGWNGLIFDSESNRIVLSSIKSLKNDYYIPEGYIEPFRFTKDNGKTAYLMVYSDNHKIRMENGEEIGLLEYLLNSEDNKKEIINSIVKNVNSMGNMDTISFDGVIMDLEGLKNRNNVKKKYVEFLQNLNIELKKMDKDLIVCLHPIRQEKSFFDGYDYKEIGEISERIIVMAHDYNPRNISDLDVNLYGGRFPLSPINDVYEAIVKALESGIPKEKIILQVALNKEQWTSDINDGIKQWKNSYISSKEIYDLMEENPLAISGYESLYQSPYIFVKDSNRNLEKIVWYEDSRSIAAKLKLAKDFGLHGISVWRLGLIGDRSHDENNKYYLDTWSEFNYNN